MEIHSVPSCMACGIIMLKNDVGIILKQWDNVPCKNFTSVAFGIQILLNNDKISAKAICNARPDQDRAPTRKTISFKYATFGMTFISRILEPCHRLDEW